MQPLYFVERRFPYSVQRLWRAWTSSSELESWYCPIYLTVIPGSAISDPVVGGRWAIAVDVSPNGFNAFFWGTYKEVAQNSKLVHELCYSQDELEFALQLPQPKAHLVQIDFVQRANGCTVRFSQFGEMNKEQSEASKEGIESYFENLERFLSSKPN